MYILLLFSTVEVLNIVLVSLVNQFENDLKYDYLDELLDI